MYLSPSLRSKSPSHSSLTPVLALSCLMLLSAACGKGGAAQLVNDVHVRTMLLEGDTYVEMIAELDTGKLQIPSISLPIFDPKNPSRTYGTLSFTPGFQSGADLEVELNLSEAFKLGGSSNPLLPNGYRIPVGGLGDTPVFNLAAGSHSQVYVAVNEGVAVIGVAVAIREFDEIGGNIPIPLNIFPRFELDKDIVGIAGIFTGPVSGQNGIAVFVDASSVIGDALEGGSDSEDPVVGPGIPVASNKAKRGVSTVVQNLERRARVHLVEEYPSARHERKLLRSLYHLNRKRARVTVER